MIKSDTKNFVDAYLLYSSGSKFGQSHYTSYYMVLLMKVQTIVCMQPHAVLHGITHDQIHTVNNSNTGLIPRM